MIYYEAGSTITDLSESDLRNGMVTNIVGPNKKQGKVEVFYRETRGHRRAVIAVARKLAVILHRMWPDDVPFRWSTEVARS